MSDGRETNEAEQQEEQPLCCVPTCPNEVVEPGTHCAACDGELFGGER